MTWLTRVGQALTCRRSGSPVAHADLWLRRENEVGSTGVSIAQYLGLFLPQNRGTFDAARRAIQGAGFAIQSSGMVTLDNGIQALQLVVMELPDQPGSFAHFLKKHNVIIGESLDSMPSNQGIARG